MDVSTLQVYLTTYQQQVWIIQDSTLNGVLLWQQDTPTLTLIVHYSQQTSVMYGRTIILLRFLSINKLSEDGQLLRLALPP